MNVHIDSRLFLYSFFKIGARWGVGGQRHAPAALPLGKNRYPLYRRLGGLQGPSGRVRKISPPQQDSNPGPSSPQQVAIPTELSRPSN